MSQTASKVCTGPAHPSAAMLPLTSEYWYFYGDSPWARDNDMVGKPIAKCRLCRALEYDSQEIPPAQIEPFARELVDRCGGYKQAERVCGVGERTLRQLVLRKQKRGVQKRTAQRILVGLSEQRKYDRRNGSSERFLEARLAQARIEERIEREGCG